MAKRSGCVAAAVLVMATVGCQSSGPTAPTGTAPSTATTQPSNGEKFEVSGVVTDAHGRPPNPMTPPRTTRLYHGAAPRDPDEAQERLLWVGASLTELGSREALGWESHLGGPGFDEDRQHSAYEHGFRSDEPFVWVVLTFATGVLSGEELEAMERKADLHLFEEQYFEGRA